MAAAVAAAVSDSLGSDAALATLARIAAIDLAPIGRRLADEKRWSAERVQQALRRYRHFLFLCWKYPDGNTPSIQVDTVWHAHILFTRKYAADCQNAIGFFLHHDPGDGTINDADKHADWYARTCQRIIDEFGDHNRWN